MRGRDGNGYRAIFGKGVFETLEHRKLLSTVNVADFGAVANDGCDDSGAIRAAVRASHAGDVISFPAGTLDIGRTINLKGNRSYDGSKLAILHGTPGLQIFEIHEDNVRVANLTFDGKPIFLDKPRGQTVSGVVIDNNIFHVHARGNNYNGISFTTGLKDSSIANNTFDPIDGDNGVYGYGWDNLTIANNEFLNGNEGIHVVDFANGSSDLLIEQNYFSGLHRMGIEIQGGGSNTIVQDNCYENPVMTGRFSDNNDTFAYSIIADRSSGTIIRRNTSIAPERPDGTGVRIVFEVGGDNTLVEQNYSVGGNQVLSANDCADTTSVKAQNNLWKGYLKGPNGHGLKKSNNGADVKLSWNVNRGKPGPNKRLDIGPAPSTQQVKPAQAPTPAPTPKPKPPKPAKGNPNAFSGVPKSNQPMTTLFWIPIFWQLRTDR